MNRFLLKIALFCCLLLIGFGSLFFLADGYTDPFYLKFTSPRQENMLLGTSRAAHGLQPRVLNNCLEREFFNYSFSLLHSPFGPVYYESIKRKVDTTARDGCFIVAVDPWSISSENDDPDDPSGFRETTGFLASVKDVTSSPNLEYLIKSLKGEYYRLVPMPRDLQLQHLHKDGWLEVKLPPDTTSFNRRSLYRAKRYLKNKMPLNRVSATRLVYLEKIVAFLKQHGKVYLVRLPVHPEMAKVEQIYMPDFKDKIKNVVTLSDGYFDMHNLNHKFLYTDGNHLHRDSGAKVSALVGKFILERSKGMALK
ncbi:hypothetical protein E7Z59_08870 [Robertkochia marina]|uniref:SGNH/GDSL hydrolase family protein n=1 Tax=Robertkochia marina TaxID=1227945 RepID=A0A4S3M2P6_9FLAO|nr:hypothetical protein [Robertkochia marina]THD67755.1 hypothetical protein E7Z59_08870 [Robertkochia marina]TRZ40920.1 hypothetical protein D3A96_14555 [Robertkochia marina]